MTNTPADQAEKVSGVEVGERRISIPGMTEEGENLAAQTNQAAEHTHGGLGETKKLTSGIGSRANRHVGFDAAGFPEPNGREEEWRFTPLKKLAGVLTDTPGEAEAVDYQVTASDAVVVSSLSQGAAPRNSVLQPADRAAVLATKNVAEALHVKVPADVEVAEPIRVDVTGRGAGRRANSHIVLEAGTHATAVFVLEHRGSADFNGNVEVVVGDGAHVKVISLQRWDDDAVHVGQHDAEVGRDATYKHVAISLGGSVIRLNTNFRYAAEGAEAEMYGLYFADSGQHIEHRTFVDHNAPRNTSNVLYKGALQGESARTVWVGDVLIRKAAEGTDSYEKNQNLVLTDGARADSVPNLEIETGLIDGAGHASSTGRFDENHLFYLMARGIPEKEARQLVVRGFLNEIIQKIGVASIEDSLQDDLENELEIAGF
ncbi:Fe-S cluster assembly protein SufD [Nesterenkonia xinjiangensis]|uniref:Fe-S cluster assembly protein SufD n=1 Tax=Nesterenkonia xinjiangensis TaxID=225327 RepID=A0A7Z0GPG8_9MICC|nr:Fe-S cluster assembly protein SufD [Nesterenkonia xinjiangensis]NYJ79664.1 Fe-S cluster assembly protein SufD [Nesterenkonia xinjiangensis]